jgi:hypothetical protein
MTTRIKIRYSDASLFDGNTDGELAPYDLSASADRYGEMLATGIAANYPDADLDIERSDGEDSTHAYTDNLPDTDVEDFCYGIQGALFGTTDWYVEATP